MQRRSVVGLVALVVVAVPGSVGAAVAPPRVVLAVDGIGQTRNLPVLVAERLGYFRDEGLTVTLVDSPGEPTPAQLLADGRADGAVAFYHHTFMTQADDQLVTQAVVTMGVTPQLKLLVASRLRGSVRTLADLKGRKIYTGGANSGKTTTTNWIARRAGFGIGGYTPLKLSSREAMEQALRTGAADAIITHEPDADRYVRSGTAFELADIETVGGTKAALGSVYPSTTLYFPIDYIATHRDVIRRLVDACLRAMKFIDSHTADDVVAVLPPKVVGADRPAFTALVAEDKQAFQTDGRMDPGAAHDEWEVMATLTPKYRSIRFGETFTNAFVDANGRSAR